MKRVRNFLRYIIEISLLQYSRRIDFCNQQIFNKSTIISYLSTANFNLSLSAPLRQKSDASTNNNEYSSDTNSTNNSHPFNYSISYTYPKAGPNPNLNTDPGSCKEFGWHHFLLFSKRKKRRNGYLFLFPG